MNKINKYLSWALVPAFALSLASCDDNKNINEDYVPQPISGEVAYFPVDGSTTFEVKSDEKTILIPVYRAETTGSMTVDIYVYSVDEFETYPYQFAETVTFEDGEKIGYLHVSYDPTEIDYDDYQQYELEIDEKYTTPYGLSSEIITIVYPSPWTDLGMGYYRDEFLSDSDGNIYTVETYFYRSDIDPNRYRVANPYYPANGEETYFEFSLLQEGSTFNGQVVDQPDLVGYDLYLIMYDASINDNIYVAFPGLFQGMENVSSWQYNKVVSYQKATDDLPAMPGEIQLAPVYLLMDAGQGYDYSKEPTIHMYFPGTEMTDNTIGVTYEGILTTNSDTYVLANVALGEDLTSAKVAIIAGVNTQGAVEAIINGTLETIDVTKSGDVRIPFDPSNSMGRYSIVAVGYADNVNKSSTSAIFSYEGSSGSGNSGWKTLGTVEYTDAFICALYTTGTFTYNLEIQENENTPGFYRLVNPYGSAYPLSEYMNYESNKTTYLYINASKPDKVRIPESPQTIIVDPNYGAITCSDQIDYWMSEGYSEQTLYEYGYFGTMVDGKITFNAQTLAIFEGNDPTAYNANVVVNSQGTDYEKNPNGTLVAPFLVDVNKISSALNLSPDGTVATRTIPDYFKMREASSLKKSIDSGKYHLRTFGREAEAKRK